MRDIRLLLKPHYANSHALVVGIDKYKNVSGLSYAVSDAAEMRKTLQDELQFPQANVAFLTDEKATKKNILKAFARFARNDIEADDRIFVFFAGHGHTRSGLRGEIGYLVPHDAEMGDVSTLIRWSELTGNSDLVRAKHILFVMDACYGGLALTRGLEGGSTRFLHDMYRRIARQVLTAGKADEVVSDSGGPLPNHSVFTGHLIEGIRGKAFSEAGVLTANALMAYVYGKVARDKNSNQTPHYGYFDGDGDFILVAPKEQESSNDPAGDTDSLVIVPFYGHEKTNDTTDQKVQHVKTLLATDSSSIQLHDYMVSEVKSFLAATSEDKFQAQGTFTVEELLRRIAQYDGAGSDLAVLTACVGYWAKASHFSLLQKVIARATDRAEAQSGQAVWITLQSYPLIVILYCAGVAAVDGGRYDSLASILLTSVTVLGYRDKTEYFFETASEAIVDLARVKVFHQIPGHERQYSPLSEYLFKAIQPKLDDPLFIGRSYEGSFDEFEVLFALIVGDARKQKDQTVWGPIGRFGWKHRRVDKSPFARVVAEACEKGAEWGPVKAGLFGGSMERFNAVVSEFNKILASLPWGF